jgi:hypothetical protein
MNLLKKITKNSKDKFNMIQKKIKINKNYIIDFKTINKEIKIVFKESDSKNKNNIKVIGDYHFFGRYNAQTKIWTWANIMPNISIEIINYIDSLRLKGYIFEKNINSSEVVMFFYQFLTTDSMFIPDEKYMGLIIDLLLYLSDDMYIFERPNSGNEIDLIGLVKINELF